MLTIISQMLLNITTFYFTLVYIQNLYKQPLVISFDVTLLSSAITIIILIQNRLINIKDNTINELNDLIYTLYDYAKCESNEDNKYTKYTKCMKV